MWWLVRQRFLWLSIGVGLLATLHASRGVWSGDFWSHSAVVQEFSAHPLSPRHPQLPIDAPHKFCSPYHWIVGVAARLVGAGPVDALACAGVANLVLFVFGLWLLCRRLELHPQTPFYALLFTLLLWGETPWFWSGFLHLEVLPYVLPYPSTFALGLALLAMALQVQLLSHRRLWLVVLQVALLWLVLLSHPMTFLFLGTGLFALTLSLTRRQILRHTTSLFTMMVAAFALAGAWPFYPFYRLIFASPSFSAAIHTMNKGMYSHLLERLWPTLFALPALLSRLRRRRYDPFPLLFALLLGLFVYGWISREWSYGRTIAHIVLVAHIALGDWLGTMERDPRRCFAVRAGCVCAAACLLYLAARDVLPEEIERHWDDHRPPVLKSLRFVQDHVPQGAVTLADQRTSWLLPSLGVKVMSSMQPLAFVQHQRQRQADARRMLAAGTPRDQRTRLLRKYRIQYVLVRSSAAADHLLMELQSLGQELATANGRTLFRVDLAPPR